MARKPAPIHIEALSDAEFVSLIIREVRRRQVFDDRMPRSDLGSLASTTSHASLEGPYFTIAQVAEKLNLSDRQVRYAIEEGLLEAYRFEGKASGTLRVHARSVTAYIERCRVKPRRSAPARADQPKGKPFKHVKLSAPEGRGSSLDS